MANNTKPSQKTGKSRKGLWIVLAAVTAITLIAGVAIYFVLNVGGNVGEQKKMESYLKDKYGKEFVVENYRIEGATIGAEGDPTADAYPKVDKELKFVVWDRGSYKEGRHAYIDNYIGASWGVDQTKSLANDLRSIFGYLPEYNVTVGSSMVLDTYNSIPSFEEAVRRFPNDISIELKVHPKEIINADSNKTHSDRVWKLIDLLKSKGVRATLSYAANNGTGGIYLEDKDLRAISSVDQITQNLKEQR